MDAEEERMAGALRKKNKGNGQLGISKIRITASVAENQQFTRQNKILFEKGLPYYKMIERGIGVSGDVFLWIEQSNVYDSYITHIELGHKDKENPLYKELQNLGYEMITNPNLNLVIFVKRDKKKSTAIDSIRISYDVSEEPRYFIDGYEKVSDGVSLHEFGLPDVYIWTHKFDREDKTEAQNTTATIADLKAARKMVKEKPNDMNVLALEKKLYDRLQAAYFYEQEAIIHNPLEYAIELMALTKSELNSWMKIFSRLDKKKNGKITTDDIFEYLNEPPTDYNVRVFYHFDALNRDGTIEFGDFLRVFGVFCFFGKNEIMR